MGNTAVCPLPLPSSKAGPSSPWHMCPSSVSRKPVWQVHCTTPRTIWHFWAQPPLLTLQFSSPVRGPVPAKPEMGVEPRILPQTANLAFHLDHEEQLPRPHESPGRILFEPHGWGSATDQGPGPPTGDTHGSSAVGFRHCCPHSH